MKTKFSSNRDAAFTLVELLVVVVILGVLAVTIIPQFMGTTHDAKAAAAKSNVAQLETAIERFNIHMDRYPTMEEGLKVLLDPPQGGDTKWKGPYIQTLRQDPWNNAFQYRIPGTQGRSRFNVYSRGADGADGGDGENADIGNW